MLKAILFDLDDTLLGNSMDTFIPAYFQALTRYVAEWIPPDSPQVQVGREVERKDGFANAGFSQLLEDPDLEGVDLDILDVNFDEVAEVPVPGGGYNQDTYFMSKTVRECDVLIDVPVLKVITSVGLTNAMKNFVGIAPGLVYGWSKSEGYPPGSGNPGTPQ